MESTPHLDSTAAEETPTDTTRDAAFIAVFTELGTIDSLSEDREAVPRSQPYSLWTERGTSHIIGMALVALLSVDHLQLRQSRSECEAGAEELPKRRSFTNRMA